MGAALSRVRTLPFAHVDVLTAPINYSSHERLAENAYVQPVVGMAIATSLSRKGEDCRREATAENEGY